MNTRSLRLKSIRRVAYAIFCFLFVASAFANNPIPTVVGPVVPQAVVPGSEAFMLKVYGANFVRGAVVNWNRSPRSTTFISARELQAQIPASDVATATAGYITVTNPPPGGGVSSPSYSLAEVHTPTATIVPQHPREYLKGDVPFFLVPTDFNNDGILDFAVSDGKRSIDVLLGKGDGTFRRSSYATQNYFSSAAIASGDFNNDGNEDLVFGVPWSGPPYELQVNIGDGNGKFRFGSRFGHFGADHNQPNAIAVGDFNGDGNLDLAVAAEGVGNIQAFLGRGDGTFQKVRNYATAFGPFVLATADFNGDGKLDLLVESANKLQILLGNGDGTFQKARNVISLPNGTGSLLITDFNGDGNPDLAFVEQESKRIGIMLGNGDGTFKRPSYLTVRTSFAIFYTAGDFNSDGKTDLLVNYLVSNTQSETDLYLGNGDGTFRKKRIVHLPGSANYNAAAGMVTGDFNSDGLLDFIFQEPFEVSVFTQK